MQTGCFRCGAPVAKRHKFCSRACCLDKGHPEPTAVPGCRWLELGHRLFALVDERDFPTVSGMQWYASKTAGHVYAATRSPTYTGLLHRLIMKAAPDQLVDHISLDGLDNRRSNLRIANKAGNGGNMRKHRGLSRFKGVYFNKRKGLWHAHIQANSVAHSLGYHFREEDAALAYDEAARRLFGEFARVNFPKVGEQPARVAA